MKRKILTVFVCVVMALSAILAVTQTPMAEEGQDPVQDLVERTAWPYSLLEDSPTQEVPEPTLEIQECDATHIVLEAHVEAVLLKEAEEAGEKYFIVSLPGQGATDEVGKAQLPKMTAMLAIPPGASVNVNILLEEKSTLPGVTVYPFQEPQLEGEQNSKFDKDRDFYRSGSFYPGTLANVASSGIMRDYEVINLVVYPVQYNPGQDTLDVYHDIRIEVEFGGIDPGYKGEKNHPVSDAFAGLYQNTITNFVAAKDWVVIQTPESTGIPGTLTDPANRADYLIIAHDSFADIIQPLAVEKTVRGLEVATITTSQIYAEFPNVLGNDESIHDLITYAYENWELQPSYVLLVGDVEFVPTHIAETSYNSIASDHYFSTVGNSDIYPDLAVGRLSAKNTDELAVMRDKIINYGKNAPPGDWTEKIMLVAHPEEAPGKYQENKEYIRTEVIEKDDYPWDIRTVYPYEGDTLVDAIEGINEGTAVINYRGHGSTTAWSNPAMTSTDVLNLQNGDKLPVVYSIACWNSNIDSGIDSMGEAWLKSENGGAVAHVGASRPSFTVPNMDFDIYLFEAMYFEDIPMVGEIMNYAKVRLLDEYGANSYAADNVLMYMMLGDPDTTLVSSLMYEHDISLSTLDLPDYVEPPQSLEVGTYVSNRGLNDESDILVEFVVDGVVMDSTTIEYLPVRQSVPVSFPWTVDSEGSFDVEIRAEVLPDEGDVLNNFAYKTVFSEIRYPTVEETTPEDGQSEVSGDALVELTFSESMEPATVDASIVPAVGGVWAWSQNNHVLTLTDRPNLVASTTYTVTIPGTATDSMGYGFDGNANGVPEGSSADDYVFSFAVDSVPPQIEYMSPRDGSDEFPVSAMIYIRFTEDMDMESVASALSFEPPVDGEAEWYENDLSRFYFYPSEYLQGASEYTITLAATARDLAGNYLDGDKDGISEGSPVDDHVSSFATDSIPPRPFGPIPDQGAIDVPLDQAVTISFTDDMDKQSMEEHFSIEPATSGYFDWVRDNKVAWRPTEKLQAGTTYTVTVGIGTEDIAGNAMTEDWTFSFTTTTMDLSDPVRVSGEDVFALEPAIAVDAFDNVHMVWEDQSTRTAEIMYSKYDSAGNVLVDRLRMTDSATYHTWHPDIAVDDAGNAYIVWTQIEFDPAIPYPLTCAMFAKVDAAGTIVAMPRSITSMNPAILPTIALDSQNEAYVAWMTTEDGAWSKGYKSYFKKLDTNGDPLTGDIKISNKFGDVKFPAIAVDENDDAHFVWYHYDPLYMWTVEDGTDPVPITYDGDIYSGNPGMGSMGNRDGVFYSKFRNDGSQPVVEDRKVEGTYIDDARPDLGIDSEGNVHVAFPNKLSGVSPIPLYAAELGLDPLLWKGDSVYYVKLDTTGKRITNPVAISTDANNYFARKPKLAVDSIDSVHVTWQEEHSWFDPTLGVYVENREIYIAKVGTEGKLVTPLLSISANMTSSSDTPGIAIDSQDDIYIAWTDDMEDGVNSIYYRKGVTPVQAWLDIEPDPINYESDTLHIFVHIELSRDYDVNDIDPATIYMNGVVPALPGYAIIGDYDHDQRPDLTVKFDKAVVCDELLVRRMYDAVLSVTGEVLGESFEGRASVKVTYYWNLY